MKIRTTFVSNSSSSSFVCDVCGHDYSGWDAGLSDANMFECTNGHVVCNDHKLNPDKIACCCGADDEDYCECYVFEVAEECCPICQFKEGLDDDLNTYILKRFDLNKEELLKELRHMFGTYKEFLNEISSK